ncbi:hypothetical protein BV25DRAFT_284450 [Artomyces pyxidatus]|uniref:Uncharacterized protein n=1 Tax=Artomyces pyxidatus TaxID=48021 RepID=A0ACB8SH13_9AGAM|nr:hypothetical protein BV25DRAFT_284450 [Artomyces pyxidatus]
MAAPSCSLSLTPILLELLPRPLLPISRMDFTGMHEVIDITSSPEPESESSRPRGVRRKRTPLFLPELEHEVIELTDSSDDDEVARKKPKMTPLRRRPQAGPSNASHSRAAAAARRVSGGSGSRKVNTQERGGGGQRQGPPQLPTPPRDISPVRQARLPTPPAHEVTPPCALPREPAPARVPTPLREPTPPPREPTPQIRPPTPPPIAFDVDFDEFIHVPYDHPLEPTRPPRVPTPPHDVVDVDFNEFIHDPHEHYVAQVREVVPDVLAAHVFELVERYEVAHPEDVVGAVLHALFEDPTYPKEVRDKGKGKAVDRSGQDSSSGGTDYSRTDREHLGLAYRTLALEQLYVDFPAIPRGHILDMLDLHEGFYAPTHLFLLKEKNDIVQPYIPEDIEAQLRRPSAKAKKKGKAKMTVEDDDFTKERKWLLEKLKNDAAERDAKLAEQMNEAEYEDTGDGIECGCCFSTYPFDKMIQCPDTHLFCGSCVTAYASTKLGEQNPDLPCMDASGCKMLFPDSELRRILPSKLLELYERVRQRREIEAAALEGLEECPFCEFRVVMDADADMDKLLRCQNDECGKVSCRKCKKEDHLPKSCEEVEEDKKLGGKHAIEEAMTRALMRNCPKCTKAFIKESGCNKMSCPYCRTMSCYVCRKIIAGYEHFDSRRPTVPPAPGDAGPSSTKCPLWDVGVEQRHVDEVTEAAKKALEEYKLLHPDVEDDDIKVDLPPPPPPPPQPAPPHLQAIPLPGGAPFPGGIPLPRNFQQQQQAHARQAMRARRQMDAQANAQHQQILQARIQLIRQQTAQMQQQRQAILQQQQAQQALYQQAIFQQQAAFQPAAFLPPHAFQWAPPMLAADPAPAAPAVPGYAALAMPVPVAPAPVDPDPALPPVVRRAPTRRRR